MVHPRWDGAAGRTWRLDDLLTGDTYERDGHDLSTNGLFVALPSWGVHMFACTPHGEQG